MSDTMSSIVLHRNAEQGLYRIIAAQNNKYILFSGFCFGIAGSLSLSLLPNFVRNIMGCDAKSFGDMNAIILAIAFALRSCSTFAIDIVADKKTFLKIGIIIALISKAFMVLSFSIFMIFIAKIMDRVSKGIRTSSINFMICDNNISGKHSDVKLFSQYDASHTTGILCGLFLVKMICSIEINENLKYRLVFLLSIPFLLYSYALANKIIALDANKHNDNNKVLHKITYDNFIALVLRTKLLPKKYWLNLLYIFIVMLSYYDIGFLQFKSCDLGITNDKIAIHQIIYNVFIIISSIISAKILFVLNSRTRFLIGSTLSCFANLIGIFASNYTSMMFVYIFGGLHIGIMHGLMYSILTGCIQPNLTKNGLAIFYLSEAVALFIGNIFAGRMGDIAIFFSLPQSSGPFIFGIILSSIAILCATRIKD